MSTSKVVVKDSHATAATQGCEKSGANVVCIEISSFAGVCPGASHFFAQLCSRDLRIELTHALTRPQALELNKKLETRLFRAGNHSSTFFSQQEIIDEAKEVWRQHFPDAKVLILGRIAVCEPQHVLVGPRGYQGPVNRLAKRREKLEWFSDLKELDAICAEWEALNTKFGIRHY